MEIEIKSYLHSKKQYLVFPPTGGHSWCIDIDKLVYRWIDTLSLVAKSEGLKYDNLDYIVKYCDRFLSNKNLKTKNKKYVVKKKVKKVEEIYVDYNNGYKTYLIKDYNTGYYKIGKSKKPKHREKTLQSEKPNIKMVKVWDYDTEKKLHSFYDKCRIRGEWFELNKIQLKYICKHF